MNKESHSKMSNLTYEDLEMQGYLKDEKIRVNQARAIFRFRTRMARFWENFKGVGPLNLVQYVKKHRVLTLKQTVSSVGSLPQTFPFMVTTVTYLDLEL